MNAQQAVRILLPLILVLVGLYVAFLYGQNGPSGPVVQSVVQTGPLGRHLTRVFTHGSNGGVSKAGLYDEVLVLCWILTHPGNHQTKAKAVKETWAPRCNKAVFMSSQVDPEIGTIDLKMSGEGRDKLWEKSRKAWYYVYQHFIDDYDWFMKADDDSFVIVENVRYLCSRYDPNGDHYFGRVFKPFGGYQSGGAGYVVSRGALKKLGPNLAEDGKCGHNIWMVEDAKFGGCLKELGIGVGNSQDNGKDRFHPFVPEQHLIPGIIPQKFWYRDYVMYPATEGPDCCSDLSISFHYISPNLMHELYFYVYRLHPYGSFKTDDDLPPPLYLRSKAGDVADGEKAANSGEAKPQDKQPAAVVAADTKAEKAADTKAEKAADTKVEKTAENLMAVDSNIKEELEKEQKKKMKEVKEKKEKKKN